MKPELFKQKFIDVFQFFSNASEPGLLKIEIALYKKLFDFFLTGETFYFSMNHHTIEFEYVSAEVTSLLGYQPEEFSVPLVLDKMHPDDRRYFISFGHAWQKFYSSHTPAQMMKYKLRFDIRLKNKVGEYRRLLYQAVMTEHDEQGIVLRTIGTYTDITYLKEGGAPVLSFIGMDGEPSYVNVPVSAIYQSNKDNLTARERQVLKLLIEGWVSKEIANYLDISKQTVDKHRKNMLNKKQLRNTNELVSKAILNGWI